MEGAGGEGEEEDVLRVCEVTRGVMSEGVQKRKKFSQVDGRRGKNTNGA